MGSLDRAVAQAQVEQQVVDDRAHRLARGDDVGEAPLALLVELVTVVALEHPGEPRDRPQRRTQVVGQGVGERAQLLVGGGEVRGAVGDALLQLHVEALAHLLGQAAFGDVLGGAPIAHDRAVGVALGAGPREDPERSTIRPDQLPLRLPLLVGRGVGARLRGGPLEVDRLAAHGARGGHVQRPIGGIALEDPVHLVRPGRLARPEVTPPDAQAVAIWCASSRADRERWASVTSVPRWRMPPSNGTIRCSIQTVVWPSGSDSSTSARRMRLVSRTSR